MHQDNPGSCEAPLLEPHHRSIPGASLDRVSPQTCPDRFHSLNSGLVFQKPHSSLTAVSIRQSLDARCDVHAVAHRFDDPAANLADQQIDQQLSVAAKISPGSGLIKVHQPRVPCQSGEQQSAKRKGNKRKMRLQTVAECPDRGPCQGLNAFISDLKYFALKESDLRPTVRPAMANWGARQCARYVWAGDLRGSILPFP